MHFVGSIAELSGKCNDLGNDELSHTSRIGKGRVEDGDTVSCCVVEVDLVGTDAEASHYEQVLGFAQDFLGKLGLGSNTDDLNITGKGGLV